MADEQDAGATPADPGATPNTPDPKDSPAAKVDEAKLGDAGLSALNRERELREAAEKREKALAKKVQAFEDADKTEAQKAAERVAELEKELAGERTARQSMSVQMASIASARKLGFRDPELAVRLVSASEVEFDDAGAPRNIERLLGDIAKQYPALVSATTDYGGGPRGTSPGAGDDMNAFIRARTGRT